MKKSLIWIALGVGIVVSAIGCGIASSRHSTWPEESLKDFPGINGPSDDGAGGESPSKYRNTGGII